MLKLYEKRTSYILDVVIGILIIAFMAVIWVPKMLWGEEDDLRASCRERMSNLYTLETEFYRVVNRYAEDPREALAVINAMIDSMKADTGYIDDQIVKIDTTLYEVNTIGDMLARVDTSFTLPIDEALLWCPFTGEEYRLKVTGGVHLSISCPIKEEIATFKILIAEPDDSLRNHYIEVLASENREFKGVSSVSEIASVQSTFMPELIILNDSLLESGGDKLVADIGALDPDVLILAMFLQEQDTTGTRTLPPVNAMLPFGFSDIELYLKVGGQLASSPRRWVREDYSKRRYLFFSMEDSTHGSIIDGDRSWLEENE